MELGSVGWLSCHGEHSLANAAEAAKSIIVSRELEHHPAKVFRENITTLA
jgi:putative NIF3 family GTP cyclohydrolase 1 type 2